MYYILHKPAGYVSATEDRYDRTVMELIPEARKGMFPVGRLDRIQKDFFLSQMTGDWLMSFYPRRIMWKKRIS